MGGLDSAKVWDVPWKRVSDRDTAPSGGLILYWIPASEAEFRNSELKVSRTLCMYAARCVSMCVLNADSQVAQKLQSGARAPLAFLANPDGSIIAKAKPSAADLKVGDLENLLNDEVEKLRESMTGKLQAAKDKADAGDSKGAIEDYRAVLQNKCLLPGLAKKAQKELKRLGVEDVSSVSDGPIFDKAVGEKISKLMFAGLKAEDNSQYQRSKTLYESAHNLDPADPIPLRYLGELYRHDIGDWDKATEIYNSILSMESDPLSRAVALHGLGKITVHNGNFKKGEELMEESLKVYPLALACRNLAVFWNSEGDPIKTNYYIDEALKLAPEDKFNRVFAAVFMAANGRGKEALEIARDNEGLLPASYNLAAIYAQVGNKEKALELLKRHFFEYERNEAVRAEEMMEARVDRVFESLVADKDFLALTSASDGKLPMPGGKMMTAH